MQRSVEVNNMRVGTGSVFYLGNYSGAREKMTLDLALGPQTIEYGFVDRWAVANYISDGRLVTIGWLRRPDTLHAPCASPIHGIPHSENRFGGEKRLTFRL